MKRGSENQNRYLAIVEWIFFEKYAEGSEEVAFERDEIESAAEALSIKLPKNLGDVVYAIRYRIDLPERITATAPKGREWIIEGAGRAKYKFRLVKINRIVPNESLLAVKIPDSTPEIIRAYSLSDEQALLAIVRYNRLIDIFLSLASQSLQNHLRTSVSGVGQIEIDEVYVGVDTFGAQYVIPVQAKGGRDQISVVQTKQDIQCCAEKFPNLICRAVSAQFVEDDLVALFELTTDNDMVKVVQEKHYRLSAASEITEIDLQKYRLT